MTTEIEIQLEKSVERPPLLRNGILIIYAPNDFTLDPRESKIVDLKFSIKMSEYISNNIQISPFLKRNGIKLSCGEGTVQLFNNGTAKLTNIHSLKTDDLSCEKIQPVDKSKDTVQFVDSGTVNLTVENDSGIFMHKIYKNTELARVGFFHHKVIVAKYRNGTENSGECSTSYRNKTENCRKCSANCKGSIKKGRVK